MFGKLRCKPSSANGRTSQSLLMWCDFFPPKKYNKLFLKILASPSNKTQTISFGVS